MKLRTDGDGNRDTGLVMSCRARTRHTYDGTRRDGRFTEASVAKDVDRVAALLRDDVRCSMPPTPGLYVGRDAMVNDWIESGFEDMGLMRAVPTSVNRQPAVAFYLWRKQEGAYLPLTIDVLRIWTAVTLTAISLVAPLLSGANTATTSALLGLHLVSATVMIPALARSLHARTD
jgi:hypothetical protein